MKKLGIALSLILVFAISIGYIFIKKNQKFLSNEEIISIYYNNRELINDIKNGLFSVVDDIPSQYFNIALRYNNEQLFCNNYPNGENLLYIQNVHNDIIEYFVSINEDLNPCILFGEVLKKDIAIQFDFLEEKTRTRAGIVYTTMPEEMRTVSHIEGNWYVYRYVLD